MVLVFRSFLQDSSKQGLSKVKVIKLLHNFKYETHYIIISIKLVTFLKIPTDTILKSNESDDFHNIRFARECMDALIQEKQHHEMIFQIWGL